MYEMGIDFVSYLMNINILSMGKLEGKLINHRKNRLTDWKISMIKKSNIVK
jgi:hypothetical protein